jgi:ubiquinol-cytochrome c reductase cytochrome c subunit
LYGSGCAGCHGQRAEGTGQAPALVGVGGADIDYMIASGRMPLTSPNARPERRPPSYGSRDRAALVAYISSLGAGGPEIPQLPPGDARSGRDLYLTNCAACHGSGGAGGTLPGGQVAPRILGVPGQQVTEAIRVGPGLMPPFGSSTLTDQQAADIVAYVGAMPDSAEHGGWDLGGLGPAAEGLIGWGLGLGTLLVVIRLLGKKAPQ